ncbi:MAG: hypothetical protein V4449_01340 [Patescibacteria group bacterium]
MQISALSENKQTIFWSFLLGLSSLLLHALPFLLFGRHPLGYDTGFYRRYLIEPFTSFPNTPVPGLGDDALIVRILLDLLRFLHLPTDFILYGTYFAFWAILPALLFLFLKPYLHTWGAFVAGMLLIGSSIAYSGYWYFLLKNALALDFMLLAFIAIERKWLLAWLALDIALVLTHKTTAIIYILTLIVLFVFSHGRRKEYGIHIALAGLLFALVNAPTVHELTVIVPSAVFLDWRTYTIFSFPLILAILLGRGAFRHSIVPKTLIAFASVSFLFVLLRLPFYERIFLFSDIALVALSAYGIRHLCSSLRSSWGTRNVLLPLMGLSLIVGLFFGNLWNQITTTLPLMPDAQIVRIEEIGKIVPVEATILTTSNEAPWFEGWTTAHIAAPGMLNDTHNLETWTHLWAGTSTEEKIAFLYDFQKPLYISTIYGLDTLLGTAPLCVEEIATDLWYVACEKEK